MHDQANRRPRLCIATIDECTLWRAEAACALAIRDCKDLTWALIREWVLSIHGAKTSTWALTREWALARDTTVYHRCTKIIFVRLSVCPSVTGGQRRSLAIECKKLELGNLCARQ